MKHSAILRLGADALLVTHVAFVGFVIFGLIFILCGGPLKWSWVRNPWFRVMHLAAIGFVVIQTWCGLICPLTTWEMHLRQRAGDDTYEGSFIAHWLQQLLYYEAPAWVFVVCYTIFGLLVVSTWITVRPRPFRQRRPS
jgi:polyferredoxin